MTLFSYKAVTLLKLQTLFTAVTPFIYTIYTKTTEFQSKHVFVFIFRMPLLFNFGKSKGMQQINGTQKELASDIVEVIHLVHTQNFPKN